MNQDKLPRFTDFMMNVYENMVMQTCGSVSLISSTPFLLQQSLRTRFSVFTEDSRQVLILLSKSNYLIEFKKFLMKGQCVISFGQTLTIDADGVFPQEAQGILSARTSQSSSITRIILNSLPERIN